MMRRRLLERGGERAGFRIASATVVRWDRSLWTSRTFVVLFAVTGDLRFSRLR